MRKFYKIFFSRPLFYIAIIFILGILSNNILNFSLILLLNLIILFGIIGLIFYFLNKKIFFYISLFLIIFFLGSYLHQNSLNLPPNHIVNYTGHRENKVLIEGLIINDPVYSKTVYGSDKVTFILDSKKIKNNDNWQKVEGKLKVNLYGHPDVFRYGDLLVLEGKLYEPFLPTNPGQFDYRQYLNRKDIYALFSSGTRDNIYITHRDKGSIFKHYILNLKHILKNRLYSLLPDEKAALISAMFLGDREDLSDLAIKNFKNSGTMHIIAISGLHVGIIVFILLGFLKLLRFPLRANYILTIFFIIGYCLLTGSRPSVVRATIMASVFLFGSSIYRKIDIYNSLALAAIIILFLNPLQIFDVGFILSFTAVLSIVCITPRIESWFYFLNNINNIYCRKSIFYFARILCASVAVWIGLFPLIWRYFNIIAPITILANLVVVPLSFILILFSILYLSISFIFFNITAIFSHLIIFLVEGIYKTSYIFSNFRFGHIYLPDIKLWYLIVFYTILICVLNYNKFSDYFKIKINKNKIIILSIIFLSLVIGDRIYETRKHRGLLNITFLDVRDGDSIFLKFPDGQRILVDTGRNIPYNSGEFIIAPFLWSEKVRTINYLILTHPHSDHIGGAPWVLRHFNVENIIEIPVSYDSKAYSEYKKAVNKKGLVPYNLFRGDIMEEFKDIKVKVLSPDKNMINSDEYSVNDKSLVLLIKYDNFYVLLSGDIMEKAIMNIVDFYPDKKEIDVLQIPHHGRITSDSILLLKENFSPKTAVFSCSDRTIKRYNVQQNIQILKDNTIRVYSTAEKGAIRIITNGKSYSVSSFLEGDFIEKTINYSE